MTMEDPLVSAPQAPLLQALPRDATLTEQVYQRLRLALLTGAIRPRQKMTTRTVADWLGVSATPAREAMARLVAEGGLELARNRIVQAPLMSLEEAEEIYEIRILLEGKLAHEAARTKERQYLADLERIFGEYRDMAGSPPAEMMMRNYAFKFTVFRAAGMPTTLRILEGLWLRIGTHMHLLKPRSQVESMTLRNFAHILDAMRQGDGAACREAMQRDLIEHRLMMVQGLAALLAEDDEDEAPA